MKLLHGVGEDHSACINGLNVSFLVNHNFECAIGGVDSLYIRASMTIGATLDRAPFVSSFDLLPNFRSPMRWKSSTCPRITPMRRGNRLVESFSVRKNQSQRHRSASAGTAPRLTSFLRRSNHSSVVLAKHSKLRPRFDCTGAAVLKVGSNRLGCWKPSRTSCFGFLATILGVEGVWVGLGVCDGL